MFESTGHGYIVQLCYGSLKCQACRSYKAWDPWENSAIILERSLAMSTRDCPLAGNKGFWVISPGNHFVFCLWGSQFFVFVFLCRRLQGSFDAAVIWKGRMRPFTVTRLVITWLFLFKWKCKCMHTGRLSGSKQAIVHQQCNFLTSNYNRDKGGIKNICKGLFRELPDSPEMAVYCCCLGFLYWTC